MRNEETLSKLKTMRLTGMYEAYELHTEDKDINNLSFEERFNLLIDCEYARRQSNKLQRLIRQANFCNPEASIEEIEYYPDRHLDKELITRLSIGQYIEDSQNMTYHKSLLLEFQHHELYLGIDILLVFSLISSKMKIK